MEQKYKEEKEVEIVAKSKEKKGLSLPVNKIDEITIRPKIQDGKVLLDNDNKKHRYIMEEENE